MSCEKLATADQPYFYHPEYGKIKIGRVKLECGKTLEDAELAYERAGRQGGPVILVCHALTGNQYTVGSQDEPGWWSGLIGPGKYIDTNVYEVITFNVLGGCSGSTGPVSQNPADGKTYQSDFPDITIRDIVTAQYMALKRMGIDNVKAIAGGSLGGMQVLEWGILFPDFSEWLIPLAVTPFLSDYAIAFNAIGRTAIMLDPAWKEGYYAEGDRITGLEIARMAGMVTYRTDKMFNLRFNREIKPISQNGTQEYQVESYLKYQGEKLSARFDANSYLCLLQAMDAHDIGSRRNGWKAALKSIKANVLFMSFSGDLLYPPGAIKEMAGILLQYGKNAFCYQVETDFGHDGFLAEYDKWGEIIETAIKSERARGKNECQPFILHS